MSGIARIVLLLSLAGATTFASEAHATDIAITVEVDRAMPRDARNAAFPRSRYATHHTTPSVARPRSLSGLAVAPAHRPTALGAIGLLACALAFASNRGGRSGRASSGATPRSRSA